MHARLFAAGLLLVTLVIVGTGPYVAAGASPAQPPPFEPMQLPQPPDRFFRGRVLDVVEEREEQAIAQDQFVQVVRVRLGSGPQVVEAEFTDVSPEQERRLSPGDLVVVAESESAAGPTYYVTDRYRLPSLGVAAVLFLGLALIFSRRRGLGAIAGLAITALVLARFVVPAIVEGRSPLLVSLVGALVITLTSIYFAHGLSLRTSIAVGSTLITLVIAWGLAITCVTMGRLFGLGSEEAFYLQLAPAAQLNMRGLLLGGIILGALGVLDDITTAQAAAVDELHKANPSLDARELYRRGLSVGREHITALVNTLFLAYAGASLPLFILFTIYNDVPLWVTLNSEFVAEEIVRTLVGSMALILAVPITTAAAAAIISRSGASGSTVAAGRHHG
jgi:uncharacterized membrane protein